MRVSRKQVLTTFAFLEGIFPCVFVGILIGLRVYVAATGRVPEFLEGWNESYFSVSSNTDGSGFIYVCLYAIYVLAKIIMALQLWNNVRLKHETRRSKYVIWMAATLLLSIIGFLLLSPLRAHHVYEIGMAFVFSALTSFLSLLTVVCIITMPWCTWLEGPASNEDDLNRFGTTRSRRFIV